MLGSWWGPKNVIYCSVNIDGVVGVLERGGGDTSTLHIAIKLLHLHIPCILTPALEPLKGTRVRGEQGCEPPGETFTT